MSTNMNNPHTTLDIVTIKDELQLIWNNTNDAIFLIAPNGAISKANPAFEALLGYTAEQLKDHSVPPIIPDHLIEYQKTFLDKMLNGERIAYYEAQRITKSGQLIDIVASYCPVLNKQGDLVLIVGMYKDVTKQVEAQRLLVENEKKYRFIAENTSDLIQVIDHNGVITYISPSVEALLNYTPLEYQDQFIFECLHEEDIPTFRNMLHELHVTQEPLKIEVRYLHKDGSQVWMEVHASYVEDEQEAKTIIVSRDISERKKYEEELKYLAFHDTLTGLPNRYHFTELLKEEMAISKKTLHHMVLMYIDVDNFKQINDTYGHAAGDTVLIEFSKRLKISTRSSDKVCRISGDEFVIILANPVTPKEAMTIAQDIQNELKTPISLGMNDIDITASIGMAQYSGEELPMEYLIKKADRALYQSKENGKKHYTFWTE
ncbi:diguanylate cyclase domain-containing protein [Bacillus pinisoli]|uniref:diguanylate cyclase domain-containing protein n=1 Tax=Bacillus pinisoli TaxID=2901866 RepID=UPI001FF12E1C|nr:diguanylate cyclase [Bacillus pinisoli]